MTQCVYTVVGTAHAHDSKEQLHMMRHPCSHLNLSAAAVCVCISQALSSFLKIPSL